MKILAIDVGGTCVKLLASDQQTSRQFLSGPTMTPHEMVKKVKELAADWPYEAISMGYPGVVVHDRIAKEPKNLAPGWVDFDFELAFDCPLKIVNDAAMQALGIYDGGTMLFLGLGTGLGSALIVRGALVPLELAHLPYRKQRTYEHYVGAAGLERLGKAKWEKHVWTVVELLRTALKPDYVVVGGGNAKELTELPSGVRLGHNVNAFVGGFRLWEETTRPVARRAGSG